jgi:hypothetical protein
MLGYHPVKTRILVGSGSQDLVGREPKLQHELDEGPQIPAPGNRGKRSGRLNGMNNPHLQARMLLKLPTTPFRDNLRVTTHPELMLASQNPDCETPGVADKLMKI